MQRVFIKLSVILASVLITLATLETCVHLYFKLSGKDITVYQPSVAYNLALADQRRFVSHPFLPFAARPGDARTIRIWRAESKRMSSLDYSMNALGFRTPDLPFDKPEGVRRIVCLGGSTTFDGQTDAETWPARLESRLRERGIHAEVINLGVDMAASPTSLINLEFVGFEYHPDLVISYDGVNDTNLIGREGVIPDYRKAYGDFNDTYRSWQSVTPTWMFRSYLVALATFALDRRGGADIGSQVMKIYKLPTSSNELKDLRLFERNLKLMRAGSNEYGAKFVAATAHWVSPDTKVRAMNNELRVFFNRERINYLDLDAMLPHNDYSIHIDNVHWTREGIERVAELWEQKIVGENLLSADIEQ